MVRRARPSKKVRPNSPIEMDTDVLLMSEWSTFAFTPLAVESKDELSMMLIIEGRYNKTDRRETFKVALPVEAASEFVQAFGEAVYYALNEKKAGISDEIAYLEAQLAKMVESQSFPEHSAAISALREIIDGAHRRKESSEQQD